jgi:hypothetical protein
MMSGPGAWMRHYTSKNFWQPLSRLLPDLACEDQEGGGASERRFGSCCDFDTDNYVMMRTRAAADGPEEVVKA